MNIRTITLRYLGWCPGIESAARFIPDKETTPTRIVLALTFLTSVFFSSFWVSQSTLLWVGFPGTSKADVWSHNPILVDRDSQLWMAFEVATQIVDMGNWPSYDKSSLYTARLSLDGSLTDVKQVLSDVDGPSAFLITEDGRWFVADSHRIFVSKDGETWDDPVQVIDNKFLVFVVDDRGYYVANNSMEGWGSVEEMPMQAWEMYPFIDENGRLAVVVVDMDQGTRDAVPVKGLYLTTMQEPGGWSEPRLLTHLNIPLRGSSPQVFYSGFREGYFLVVSDPDPSSYIQEKWVYFTRDFESWGIPALMESADAGKGVSLTMVSLSLMELQDGQLVAAFNGWKSNISNFPESVELISRGNYVTVSEDGIRWGVPVEIEGVIDDEALTEVAAHIRVAPSVIISLVVTLATLYLIGTSQLLFIKH